MAASDADVGMQDKLFPGRQFISTVLEAFESKGRMSRDLWKVYLMRAAMAGILIGLFYMAYYGIEATFGEVAIAGSESLLPIGKFIGAIFFGFALVFIYFSKSELLTSNMMVGSVGAYYDHSRWPRVLRILGLCYLGNFLGGLFIAVVFAGSSLLDGGTAELMGHSVEVKTGYLSEGISGWTDLFVRAILCNFLINIGMLLCYNGAIHADGAKITVMVIAVFIFAFLGLEHSVANTALFLVYGLQYGVDIGAAAANVAVVLVGNFVGGGLLVGVYYAYANDPRRVKARKDSSEPEPAA